jgi:hypothetical protein
VSKLVTEKFQVDYDLQTNDDAHSGWKSDKSARVKKGTPGREGLAGGDPASQKMNNAVQFESIPPGMDMEDQEVSDQRVMKLTMGGETDVSRDWNSEAVRQGYTRRDLRPTDDLYSNEHADAFYDEITVDGVTGYLERNNMLDRS